MSEEREDLLPRPSVLDVPEWLKEKANEPPDKNKEPQTRPDWWNER